MKVRFLKHDEAMNEFASSNYLKVHSSDEMRIKLLRYCQGYNPDLPLYEQLLQCYSKKIRPFSSVEKRLLKFYFKRIYAHLRRKAPWLLPKGKPIGLIRLDYGVDWNAPFTINHNIVIPELLLQTMELGYTKHQMRKNKNANKCILTLCHEFVHIIQRYPDVYPKQTTKFDNTYRKWGFIPIKPSQLDWSQVDMEKLIPLRTNPDGPSFQWLFPLRGTIYMPIFGEIGGDDEKSGKMGGALVQVKKLPNGKFKVTNDWDYTKNFDDYLKLFYNRDEQLYHPNEIMAVYLCGVYM